MTADNNVPLKKKPFILASIHNIKTVAVGLG